MVILMQRFMFTPVLVCFLLFNWLFFSFLVFAGGGVYVCMFCVCVCVSLCMCMCVSVCVCVCVCTRTHMLSTVFY